MGCPYFLPLVRSTRPVAFRLPLGAFWSGKCCASGPPGFTPDEETQIDCCNFGYARERCPRFPAAAEWDAVRFTRRGEQCLFILEKEHYPAKFGALTEIEPGCLLEKQAQAWNST